MFNNDPIAEPILPSYVFFMLIQYLDGGCYKNFGCKNLQKKIIKKSLTMSQTSNGVSLHHIRFLNKRSKSKKEVYVTLPEGGEHKISEFFGRGRLKIF